jgi:hypothetical protein
MFEVTLDCLRSVEPSDIFADHTLQAPGRQCYPVIVLLCEQERLQFFVDGPTCGGI